MSNIERKRILELVNVHGQELLSEEGEKYLDDKEIVLTAIKNGLFDDDYEFTSEKEYDFKQISQNLRDDKEVVMSAIENGLFRYVKGYTDAFKHISPRLQKDRDVILAILKDYPLVINDVDKKAPCYPEVAKKALEIFERLFEVDPYNEETEEFDYDNVEDYVYNLMYASHSGRDYEPFEDTLNQLRTEVRKMNVRR